MLYGMTVCGRHMAVPYPTIPRKCTTVTSAAPWGEHLLLRSNGLSRSLGRMVPLDYNLCS